MKRIYGDTRARLLTYVDRNGRNGCWLWLRSLQPSGYGQIKINGRVVLAHRASYELHVGPIPAGKHIDHLCRNRACVNPAHLQVVDPIDNWRRGDSPTRVNASRTHCVHDHPLSGENLWVHPRTGGRVCLTCKRVNGRRWMDANRSEVYARRRARKTAERQAA